MLIEVYHDTVCPWCRIGKRHLQLALEQWQGEPVEVQYRTYFLNENLPPEGEPFVPYMAAKFGGRGSLNHIFDTPRQRGEAVGLRFNFEAIQRAPHTLLSHCLIALTPAENKVAMIDTLYQAYFEDGQDIGDLETLVRLAQAQGQSAEQVRGALQRGDHTEEVLAEVETARQLGIRGVPYFIFDQRLAFSGAQPPEMILKVIQQAAATH